ncbi:release factor glutamine methyltransferase isoform X2 [Ricinus communis]|uniref:release factor glutamine methyltransferase isoform X2 n=1 Tax=Ricinus communis TaxID=3988 RepID=UPI00201A77B1|nr:release factor glutamine methyltransferase isoform X2 [Ricinus communis]
MKLSCSTLCVSHIPSLCATICRRPICFSSLKIQNPLFLRPPVYSTSLSELNKWQQWAKHLASSVGSSFVNLDNGPDSTLLCRELKWLIEDSLEDHSLIPQLCIQNNFRNVKLRASLDELYSLWRQRIEERKPFQYIVGCEHWRDFVLSVQEGVLIPRPETELIIDLVKGAVLNNEELSEGLWADLGTGSGALAIGISKILGPQGRVIATDLSPVAASVATYNVQRYDLQGMVEVRKGSWFEPLNDVEGKLAGVVSNPPYIPSDDISGLQAEVGRHEPRIALDGGISGMDDLLHLTNGAASILKPGGFFAFETNGEKQCKFLLHHMENECSGCFFNVNIVSDCAGIQRFLTGFRQ